jgi:hypothetical protein
MVLGRGRGAGGGGRSRHRDRSGSARLGCWIGWGDGLGPHVRGGSATVLSLASYSFDVSRRSIDSRLVSLTLR